MQCRKKRTRAIRKFKYILTAIVFLILAMYTSSLLLRIDAIQQYVAERVSEGIRNYGKLPLEIGSVRVRHLNKIEINDILLNDQQGDTMACVKKLTLHVSPQRLLREQIRVNTITLAKPDIRIYRESPDSCTNLQFILDLFASNDTTESIIPETRINQLQIYDGKVTYDIRSKEPSSKSFDPGHIAVYDISTNISLKKLDSDTLSLYIRNISAKESSGLQINSLRANLNASKKVCRLERFRLSLPKSRITSDSIAVALHWNEEGKKIQNIDYRGKIICRPLSPADIQALLPILAKIPSADIKAEFNGTANSANIKSIEIATAGENIHLSAAGRVEKREGKPLFSLDIPALKIKEEGFKSLYPILPQSIEQFKPHQKLGAIELVGKVENGTNNIFFSSQINTGSGTVNAKLTLDEKQHFVARLQGRRINLKRITGNNNFGLCNIGAVADGKFHNREKFSGKYLTSIKSLTFKEYDYENIAIAGDFENNKATATLTSSDSNIALEAKATYELREGIPNIKLKAQIDSLHLHELNLSEKYKGENISFNIQTEFSGKSIEESIINSDIYDFCVTTPDDSLIMHYLHLRGNTMGDRHSLYLDSDIMQGYLLGFFNYSSLANSIHRMVNQTLPALSSNRHRNNIQNKYVFRYEINNSSIINHFIKLPIRINKESYVEGNCDDSFNHFEITANLHDTDIAGSKYKNIKISGKGDQEKIVCKSNFILPIKKKISRNEIIRDEISISSNSIIRDDSIKNFIEWVSDGPIKNKGDLNINIGIANNNDSIEVSMHLLPGIITNDGELWSISESNIYSNAGKFHINNLAIHNKDKRLSVNGTIGDQEEDSLKVNLSHIDIGKLMEIANFRPVALDGIATGNVNVSRILKTPKLNTRLHVDNFKFENGYMGEMIFEGRWDEDTKAVILDANIIDGTHATTLLRGFVSPANDTINLGLRAQNTRIEFLNHMLSSIMSDVDAVANGNLYIRGSLKNINLYGALAPTGRLRIKQINTAYNVAGDTIRFDYNKIKFDNFKVKDMYGNSGILNGGVYHRRLKEWSCKFDILADNLLAYYSSDFSTLPFYGTAFVTGDASLNVAPDGISLSTNVRTNKGSKIVYNTSGPEGAKENNFVTFVDRNKIKDKKSKSGEDETIVIKNKLKSDLRLDFMIDVSPEALVRVYTNTVTDDYLDIYGSGAINAIYDDREGFSMQGNLDLARGTYKFTFQDIFPKEFSIQSGSTLIFNGDPYYANLNLKALYTVPSVSLTDLSLTAERRKSVKVNCLMDITGTLAAPNLAFSLELPDANEEEKEMLANATSTQEQTTMQFIYLLGIGKFYTYDFNNQGQTTTAVESLFSSTISGQLNNMLSHITNNDNWNLSSNFSTSERGWNSMEVEGMLSGRLLDNRLLVNGNFGYRNNPIDNKNFIGDFEVEWLLNKNGNISLKAYNKTNDRYFSKTTLTTQGAGIMLRHDFNKWFPWLKEKKENTQQE